MEIDLNVYENVEDMVGYVGFIRPDGKFYRVRKHSLDPNIGLSHEEWSIAYFKTLKLGLLTKAFANPYQYLYNDLKYAIISEDGDSIYIVDEYKTYNYTQYQRFNELKDLYDRDYK